MTILQTDRDILQSPVQYLKGVGPKRAALLNRLGVEKVKDLFYLIPRRYEDRSRLKSVSQITLGQFETIKGEVLALGKRRVRGGMWIFQIAVGDATGVVHAVWFNQPYLADLFKKGDSVILYGKVQLYGRKLQMHTPEYEIMEGDETDLIHTGKIVPIYPLTESLNQRSLRILVKNTLDQHLDSIDEALPGEIIIKFGLIGIKEAVQNIHFPQDMRFREKAYRRLVFEEFFMFQLALCMKKSKTEHQKGISHKVDGALVKNFITALPFKLTSAQEKVLNQICHDMSLPRPMNRLVQGDVGCGKTVVAAAALVMAVDGGYQGALMSPTEVLARQHYKNVKGLIGAMPVKIALLIGEMKKDEKDEILRKLKEGEIDILIGTHSLIENSVEFRNLGIAVIDEQHKFGVAQRAVLKSKGFSPDTLVMTATPIPRTLSLTVYGDLDVSLIDELPPGRQKVMTYWITRNKLPDAYGFIKKQIDEGRQAYIIYPLIDESEKSELKAAVMMAERLKKSFFKDISVGLVHGRMAGEEREEIMKGFYSGDVKVLISTTVIEVGIDVRNATVILIENAERFGLAQLHQLRGRVARSGHKAYCILEGNPKTEDGVKRLNIMKGTSDGFKIAEEDLAIRGPGEFFGERQHGLSDIRIGNIVTDFPLMQAARSEAEEILKRGDLKTSPDFEPLRKNFRERFSGKFNLISVG